MRVVITLGLVFALAGGRTPAAPALKGPGIVGEWVVERQETGGGVLPFGGESAIRFLFTADGKWAWYTDGSPKVSDRKYTVDLTAKPHAIDLGSEPDTTNPYPQLGVFRVEGDVLTLCYSYRKEQRPKALAVGEDDPFSLYVLKRVK